jgi:hypothetical protein
MAVETDDPSRAVVSVGANGALGRGFVVPTADPHISVILTAAHCLPHLPPAHPFSYTWERTFQNLIGPLEHPSKLWCECLFADPVADVAILGAPDSQQWGDEWEAFVTFIDDTPTLPIAALNTGDLMPVRVLGLDGHWREFTAKLVPRLVVLEVEMSPGMSGSPILTMDGAAIGIISTDLLNPRLPAALPMWFLATPAPR